MQVKIATEAGSPERDNEDFAAVAPGALVLVDGAGLPPGVESGCHHSVAWYARRLGGLLLAASVDRRQTLADGLAASIERVTAMHGSACDLGHPNTPSATVIAVRVAGERLEYLVLCDSVLLIDQPEPLVITDERLGRVSAEVVPGTGVAAQLQHFAAHRNQPGGFWVASTDPRAAYEAISGSMAVTDVPAIAALSDGASRLADRFGLLSWPGLLDILRAEGPEALISRTREAEARDPDGQRWRRGKRSDDATAVYWPLNI